MIHDTKPVSAKFYLQTFQSRLSISCLVSFPLLLLLFIGFLSISLLLHLLSTLLITHDAWIHFIISIFLVLVSLLISMLVLGLLPLIKVILSIDLSLVCFCTWIVFVDFFFYAPGITVVKWARADMLDRKLSGCAAIRFSFCADCVFLFTSLELHLYIILHAR